MVLSPTTPIFRTSCNFNVSISGNKFLLDIHDINEPQFRFFTQWYYAHLSCRLHSIAPCDVNMSEHIHNFSFRMPTRNPTLLISTHLTARLFALKIVLTFPLPYELRSLIFLRLFKWFISYDVWYSLVKMMNPHVSTLYSRYFSTEALRMDHVLEVPSEFVVAKITDFHHIPDVNAIMYCPIRDMEMVD